MNKITFEVRNGVTYCLLNGVVIGQATKAELGMTEDEVLELIEGNPDMDPTEVLEKIKIGDKVFSVGGSSNVYELKLTDLTPTAKEGEYQLSQELIEVINEYKRPIYINSEILVFFGLTSITQMMVYPTSEVQFFGGKHYSSLTFFDTEMSGEVGEFQTGFSVYQVSGDVYGIVFPKSKTFVKANDTLIGDEKELESLKIGQNSYKIPNNVYVVKDFDCNYQSRHHYDDYDDYSFTISDSLLTAIQENKNLCVGKVEVGSSSSKLSELLFGGTALANAHEAILTLDYHNDDKTFFDYSTFNDDGDGNNCAIVSFEASVDSRTSTVKLRFRVRNIRVQEGLDPVVTDGNLVLSETQTSDLLVQFNVTEKLPMNQSIYNLTFIDTENVISSLPQDKPVVFVMPNDYDMMFVIDDNLENKILSSAGEMVSLPFLTIEDFENYHVSNTSGGAKVYSFTVTPSTIAKVGNLNSATPLRILNGKHSASGSSSSTTYVFKTPSITRYDKNGDPVQEDLNTVDYAITFSKATFDRFIAELPNDVNFPTGMQVPRSADEVLIFLNSAFQETSLAEQNVAWLMMMILINNSDNATAKFVIPGGTLVSKLPQKLEADITTLFFSGFQSFNTGSGISAFSSFYQMVPDAQTGYAYGLSATWSLDKISGGGGGDTPSTTTKTYHTELKYRYEYVQKNQQDEDVDVYTEFKFIFEDYNEEMASGFIQMAQSQGYTGNDLNGALDYIVNSIMNNEQLSNRQKMMALNNWVSLAALNLKTDYNIIGTDADDPGLVSEFRGRLITARLWDQQPVLGYIDASGKYSQLPLPDLWDNEFTASQTTTIKETSSGGSGGDTPSTSSVKKYRLYFKQNNTVTLNRGQAGDQDFDMEVYRLFGFEFEGEDIATKYNDFITLINSQYSTSFPSISSETDIPQSLKNIIATLIAGGIDSLALHLGLCLLVQIISRKPDTTVEQLTTNGVMDPSSFYSVHMFGTTGGYFDTETIFEYYTYYGGWQTGYHGMFPTPMPSDSITSISTSSNQGSAIHTLPLPLSLVDDYDVVFEEMSSSGSGGGSSPSGEEQYYEVRLSSQLPNLENVYETVTLLLREADEYPQNYLAYITNINQRIDNLNSSMGLTIPHYENIKSIKSIFDYINTLSDNSVKKQLENYAMEIVFNSNVVRIISAYGAVNYLVGANISLSSTYDDGLDDKNGFYVYKSGTDYSNNPYYVVYDNETETLVSSYKNYTCEIKSFSASGSGGNSVSSGVYYEIKTNDIAFYDENGTQETSDDVLTNLRITISEGQFEALKIRMGLPSSATINDLLTQLNSVFTETSASASNVAYQLFVKSSGYCQFWSKDEHNDILFEFALIPFGYGLKTLGSNGQFSWFTLVDDNEIPMGISATWTLTEYGTSGGSSTNENPYDYIQIVLPNSNHLIFMADKKFSRASSTISSVNQLIETLNQMGSLEIPSITTLEDLSQTVDYINNLDTSTYTQIKVIFWASVFNLFPLISLSVKGYVNGEIVPVNVAGIADTGTSTFAYSVKYIDSTCAWNTIADNQSVFNFQLFINELD